jgi:hypothetical protein
MLRKLKWQILAARYNWCQGPVPGRGPAVDKHWGLRPLASWACEFESHWGHGFLSVVSIVCCRVEVSATSWSLVQRSLTDYGASLCVIKKPREWEGPGPLGAVASKANKVLAIAKASYPLTLYSKLFLHIEFLKISWSFVMLMVSAGKLRVLYESDKLPCGCLQQ